MKRYDFLGAVIGAAAAVAMVVVAKLLERSEVAEVEVETVDRFDFDDDQVRTIFEQIMYDAFIRSET